MVFKDLPTITIGGLILNFSRTILGHGRNLVIPTYPQNYSKSR
jgi:hypothetical protein